MLLIVRHFRRGDPINIFVGNLKQFETPDDKDGKRKRRIGRKQIDRSVAGALDNRPRHTFTGSTGTAARTLSAPSQLLRCNFVRRS